MNTNDNVKNTLKGIIFRFPERLIYLETGIRQKESFSKVMNRIIWLLGLIWAVLK